MDKLFFDNHDHNYYEARVEEDKLCIYLLNMNTYKRNFMVELEPIELARRMLDKEIRKLSKSEDAKLRLLFGDENETG